MMLQKGLTSQNELRKALLSIFLEQMMISPKMKPLFFYNMIMNHLRKYGKNNKPECPASPPKGKHSQLTT
jgi:hypothetical protein